MTRVRIIVTKHRGKERREAFKFLGDLHGVLCCSNYAERVVSSFVHQIKSEYYGRNSSVSIKRIALEHSNVLQPSSTFLASDHTSHQAVFHYYFSDDTNQDS